MSKPTIRIHKTHLLARRRRRTSSNDVSSRRQLTLRSAIKTNQPIVSACFASRRPRAVVVAPDTIGNRRHSSRLWKDTLDPNSNLPPKLHSSCFFAFATDARTHRSGKLPRDVRQRRPRGRARGFHAALATSSFPVRRAFRTVGVRVHVFLVVKERELKLGAKRCAIVARGRVRPETTSGRTGGSIDARGDEHDARRARGGGFGGSEGVRL